MLMFPHSSQNNQLQNMKMYDDIGTSLSSSVFFNLIENTNMRMKREMHVTMQQSLMFNNTELYCSKLMDKGSVQPIANSCSCVQKNIYLQV